MFRNTYKQMREGGESPEEANEVAEAAACGGGGGASAGAHASDPDGDNYQTTDSKGVADCYVFKSRLQEYAQKVGIPTPVYQTIKEGPSHEPVFKSTVIVNNESYHSLPGFFNRKSAEQSAAEVALIEIHKSGHMTESIPTVHETGLCKNLLQEYAQKMNYAIPSYVCNRSLYGANPFTCTVEIGGIQYIGAAARTKKEAEIKAARTALLAIQSQSQKSTGGAPPFTVLPGRRKGKEHEAQTEAVKKLKSRKDKFKKRLSKRRLPRKKNDKTVNLNTNEDGNTNVKDVSPIFDKDRGVLEANNYSAQHEPLALLPEPVRSKHVGLGEKLDVLEM